jgi:hypothetical protein
VRFSEDTPAVQARARTEVAAWREQNPDGTVEEMLAALGPASTRTTARCSGPPCSARTSSRTARASGPPWVRIRGPSDRRPGGKQPTGNCGCRDSRLSVRARQGRRPMRHRPQAAGGGGHDR